MGLSYPVRIVKITQKFGANPAFYAKFGEKGHDGVDFGVPVGTPVYASAAGRVAFEGWGSADSWTLSPGGIVCRIRHLTCFTEYAHLSRTIVNKGQLVKKGQLIGYSGATGVVTGPHLHWERFPLFPNFKNGYAGRTDPLPYVG